MSHNSLDRMFAREGRHSPDDETTELPAGTTQPPTGTEPATVTTEPPTDGAPGAVRHRDDGPADDTPVDEEFDDDPAVPPRRRANKVTVALVACLVLVAAFVGGVAVQKHAAPATGFAAAGARQGTGAAAGGYGVRAAGGFPGAESGTGTAPGGTAPGGTAAGSSADGTQAGTGTTGTTTGTTSGGTSAAATPAVIGHVVTVTANSLTVKNLGGKTVTVHLSAATTVTAAWSGPGATPALRAGQTVTVAGTTAADGSVTATSVTNRGTG